MVSKKCECGIVIHGTSEKHLNSNMNIHKKSKVHKLIVGKKK